MVEKAKAAKEKEEQATKEAINPPEIDSKYRMILLAAQRSKQLQRGALSRVDIDTRKNKPTRVAMKEIQNRKVDFEILEPDNSASK